MSSKFEKTFEGQYSGEKILLRTHPHLGFFFLQNATIVAFGLIALAIIMLLGYFFLEYIIIFMIIAICIIMSIVFYLVKMYSASRYTITSRRCIYFVPKSIFKKSYNEIHLVDLRTAVPKKSGILGAIFGYGSLILTDKDDKKIIYHGLFEHKFVARYLSRIIDYIKIHGHTDHLSQYQNRKERKNHNNT